MNKIDIKGKRIAAIDFGFKRVGFAVCDEFHITVSPKKVFDYSSENFWPDFFSELEKENVAALVIGKPVRNDGVKSKVIEEIEKIEEKVQSETNLAVYTFDESFTSKRAVETMVAIGKKKNKRKQKGQTDLIAAAIILREFLEEL